ncbi:MAG: hypothetical protein K2G52_04305 [Muribaculaceae bacterium]|nr:hypothetical protein [Muribaculaceae bacterium]
MNESIKQMLISDQMLSEIEELEVLGGVSDDVHVYAVDSCKPNTNCSGGYCANCTTQCACDDKGEQGEDGNKEKP